MPLVPVRLATGRTKDVCFQHFSPRLERLSRSRVCVLRACASRPHVSGHPNSPTHKEMMNDRATASADGTTCDNEDKNINMMWCSGCGGEGVISTLSKKQKRARRLNREAAAVETTERQRDSLSPTSRTKTLPAKLAPVNIVGPPATPDGTPQRPHPASPRVAIIGAGIGVQLLLWHYNSVAFTYLYSSETRHF